MRFDFKEMMKAGKMDSRGQVSPLVGVVISVIIAGIIILNVNSGSVYATNSLILLVQNTILPLTALAAGAAVVLSFFRA